MLGAKGEMFGLRSRLQYEGNKAAVPVHAYLCYLYPSFLTTNNRSFFLHECSDLVNSVAIVTYEVIYANTSVQTSQHFPHRPRKHSETCAE